MSNNKSFYITTTLPYINSDPHIGFAAEIIAFVKKSWVESVLPSLTVCKYPFGCLNFAEAVLLSTTALLVAVELEALKA